MKKYNIQVNFYIKKMVKNKKIPIILSTICFVRIKLNSECPLLNVLYFIIENYACQNNVKIFSSLLF